jgi:hypothetical protein
MLKHIMRRTDMTHSIEVTEAPVDDPRFKEGWDVFMIEGASPSAPGETRNISLMIDKACAIFFVASDFEVLSLLVGKHVVSLVASDRVEGSTREWRVRNGPIDVPTGTCVVLRVKNDGTQSAKPLITYISRTPCAGGVPCP